MELYQEILRHVLANEKVLSRVSGVPTGAPFFIVLFGGTPYPPAVPRTHKWGDRSGR